MDQTAFPTDHMTLFLLLPLVLSFIIFLVNHITSPSSTKKPQLPPGPKPWPLLGNIPHIATLNPHVSLSNLSHLHGPLFSLRLGSRLLVVGSSPKAAAEILKTHDRLLSARYIPNSTQVLDRIALVWASECTDGWKSLRTLCRTELFSAKAIESQASLREKKVKEMVGFLRSKQGQVVNVGEVVFTTVFNTVSNLLISKDFISWDDEGAASGLRNLVRRVIKLAGTPNVSDFYPVLARLDPQGLKRKLGECVKEMFGVWEVCVKERRESRRHGRLHDDAPHRDFLDVFLANGFDDDQINWLFFELFSAGTDTSMTTTEWAMAEMLNNKHVMKRFKEQEVLLHTHHHNITESLLTKLPYLSACVKETLRLHPPAPFLLPHRAPATCEIMGYTVPKDSQIVVNVWAIGRDPTIWKDPLSLKPERFVDSSDDDDLNFKSHHDFGFLPFGAGRRICPGVAMAVPQVQLILATLLCCFDWCLPNGEDVDDDDNKLDMNEKFDLGLHKEQPLLLVPKPIL